MNTKKNKIIKFKPANNNPEIRKRKLLRLNKTTNIINLSFEKILEVKIKQLSL